MAILFLDAGMHPGDRPVANPDAGVLASPQPGTFARHREASPFVQAAGAEQGGGKESLGGNDPNECAGGFCHRRGAQWLSRSRAGDEGVGGLLRIERSPAEGGPLREEALHLRSRGFARSPFFAPCLLEIQFTSL